MATSKEPSSSPPPRPSLTMRGVMYTISQSFPTVPGISGHTLRQNNDNSRILYLDTRPLSEYTVSHIPGSKQIEHSTDEPWKNIDFHDIDKVVCYCSVGYRSGVLANKLLPYLQSQGIPVYNLKGGLFQWAIEGGELVGEIPNKVHQYSSLWGKLLPEHLRYTEETTSNL